MSLAVLWSESLYGHCDADRMFVHSNGRVFEMVGVVIDEGLVLDLANIIFSSPLLA